MFYTPVWSDVVDDWDASEIFWSENALAGLTHNEPGNIRLLKDYNYAMTASIPSSSLALTAYTDAMDFVQVVPYPLTEMVTVRLETTAISNSAASAEIDLGLQHSSDNVTYIDIPQLASPLISLFDEGGAIEGEGVTVLLPPNVKRFVRAKVSISAGSAASSAGLQGSYSASVLF